MKVFWCENNNFELVDTTKGKGKDLVFVPNLLIFTNNYKEIYRFYNVFRGDALYLAETDEFEFRQIDGINTKQELIELKQVVDAGRDRAFSWTYMKFNKTRICYRALAGQEHMAKRKRFDPSFSEKMLFFGLTKTYLGGYFFNNARADIEYNDVRQADVNSMYSWLMVSQKMPMGFVRQKAETFNARENFFGNFIVELKNTDEFLFHWKGYSPTQKTITGWFNNLDFQFFSKLVGIKRIKIIGKWFWKVSLEELPPVYTNFINKIYKKKQACDIELAKNPNNREAKLLRKKYKNGLERVYGNCLKARFHLTQWTWDEEKNDFSNGCFQPEEVDEPEWVELKKKYQYTLFPYCWGVWVCSYARLYLLCKQKELGDAAVYGDIDSIKFVGNHWDKFSVGNELGQWKDEGTYARAKFLELKRYCGLLENGELEVKYSGADIKMIKEYMLEHDDPIKVFTLNWIDIKPFQIMIEENGKLILKRVNSIELTGGNVYVKEGKESRKEIEFIV